MSARTSTVPRPALAAWAIALALVLLAPGLAPVCAEAQTVQEREPWRPPALQATPTCDVWAGPGHGNDPTLELELQICMDGEKVSGQSQYSALRSGWSARSVEGAWVDGHTRLRMREPAIIQNKPNPGWRFCTIDAYDLALSADGLSLDGTYDSAACRDHGQLALKLTARSVGDGGVLDRSEHDGPRVVAPAPSAIPPTSPPRRGLFSCARE